MNAKTLFSYILFFTSNHAFRAEKLLLAETLACKLVPVPRQFSSECGVCLRISPDTCAEAERLLRSKQIEIDGVRHA